MSSLVYILQILVCMLGSSKYHHEVILSQITLAAILGFGLIGGGEIFRGHFFLPWRRTMLHCHVAQHGMTLRVGG